MAEENIYKYLADTYGVNLSTEQKGWWRRWAENTRRKRWVDQIEVIRKVNPETGKQETTVGIPTGKTNTVGNKKDLSQEPTVMEDIYTRIYNDYHNKPPERQEGFFRVLDHMIFNGKEYDLTRVQKAREDWHRSIINYSKKKHGEQSKWIDYTAEEIKLQSEYLAKKEISEAIDMVHNKMWKQGYYYMGGKGDNKKMYFVRKHPILQNNIKKKNKFFNIMQDTFIEDGKRRWIRERKRFQRGEITKEEYNAIKSNLIKSKADFKRLYKSGLKRWKEKHPNIKEGSATKYKEMYINNALYDVLNNGYLVRKDNVLIDFKTGLSKAIGDGMINTPKGYNKRAQIWFNTGLKANPAHVFRHMSDAGVESNGENFQVGFFKDADPRIKKTLNSSAEDYQEITDGAIYAREGVVDALNLDKGLPTSGKVNKSFIVAPDAEHGAVLGKYMIHTASPRLEKYMRDNDLHMLIPESAAKQVGTRDFGNLIENNGKIEFNGSKYPLEIDSFRTIMSEITSEKYIKNQRIPKQMFTTLSIYGYKDIKPETIRDMYEELSNRGFNGTEKGREVASRFIKNPTNDDNIKELVDSVDEIPVQKLLEIMRNPKYEKFTVKAYEEILRLNREITESLAEESEVSRVELQRTADIASEFETIIDRLVKLYPEGSMGAYLHKFSRDYRMTAMRNFVVTQLTRPKIENSATARMRPWEVGLRHETEELKNRDDIFYLDDSFKSLRINDPILIKGRNRLIDVFNDLENGVYKGESKEIVKEMLNATVMRVPMDSMSGANVLEFRGFTGVRGYGSLLHPRTMSQLGGADLDGDKAFIFFGGENVGFRKSWKDMYKAQRDEFIDKKKNIEKPNKDSKDPHGLGTYRKQLAIDNTEIQTDGKNTASQYSPYWREFMSEGASSGRDMLGFAVTNRAAVIGAYNALRSYDGKKRALNEVVLTQYGEIVKDIDGNPRKGTIYIDKGEYRVPVIIGKGKKEYDVVFKIKTNEIDLQRFREMARASIALGSDPMDEAGLQKMEIFSRKVLDTLFNYEIQRNGKTVEQLTEMHDDYGGMNFRGRGLHALFSQVNKVLYSKNYVESRAHTFSEIQ